MSNLAKNDKICYFAFDVERTGNFLETDVAFALGWAYGTDSTNVVKGNACLKLHRSPDESWESVWVRNGYENSTYAEFWSQHENVLNDLQNSDLVNLVETESGMVHAFRNAMIKAESEYERVVMVTDNDNDFTWTSVLLSKYGFLGPNYNQTTNSYRGAIVHTGSYKRGAYMYRFEHPGDKPWERCDVYSKHFIPCHDHNPQNDARSILSDCFAVNAYVAKCRREKSEL